MVRKNHRRNNDERWITAVDRDVRLSLTGKLCSFHVPCGFQGMTEGLSTHLERDRPKFFTKFLVITWT